jgi:hypothetical protein
LFYKQKNKEEKKTERKNALGKREKAPRETVYKRRIK